jgi:predicted short-subunit dehydrogenase-like oxidoreductase (DUF2520 family)
MTPTHRSRKVARVDASLSKVSIVGTGAVGSTLGLLFFQKGYTIASLVNRTPKPALALAKEVHCKKVSTSVAGIAPETEVLIFAVLDDALSDVVKQTAKQARLRKPLVLHTSGVHTLDVLRPLENKGARIGSLHPIQSFPSARTVREFMKNLDSIHFGIEGKGKALGEVQHLVRVLGGNSVCVPNGMKPLYHALCVFSSNYIVTVLNAVSETARPLGFDHIWKEMVLPLLTTTVENAMKTSPQLALTGPVARNDLQTVALHLEALGKFAPQLLPLYTVLGIETARIARQSGRLTPEGFKEFVALMRKHIKKFRTGTQQKEKR